MKLKLILTVFCILQSVAAQQNTIVDGYRESYLVWRMHLRNLCYRNETADFKAYSPPDKFNDPQLLLPSQYVHKNLFQMDRDKMLFGQLDYAPWSGDYWPYYKGLLANRFSSHEFNKMSQWKEKYDYVKSESARNIFRSGNLQRINSLSPAEKYDLLSDDDSFPLTQYMWGQGKEFFDRDGKVEPWMGLCHGWAAAAILTQRPRNKVEMMAFDNNTKIAFYPDEIKALLSYAWSKANYPAQYAGRRCQEKDPKKDENGRFKNPECNDLNPATWHIVTVNQISSLKQSFIMDATYNYEVWNFPVYSYEYYYTNLSSGKSSLNINDALIDIENYKQDPYKHLRTPGTKYIVGINMTVGYASETLARQFDRDDGQNDFYQAMNLIYDLELDKDGIIIGGEWRQEEHPDFIWKPADNASAYNYFDQKVEPRTLSKENSLSPRWKQVSQLAAFYGYVLYGLVDYILSESSQ